MIDDEDQVEKDDEIEEAQEHFTQLVCQCLLCSISCESRASEKAFRAACKAQLLSSKEDSRLAEYLSKPYANTTSSNRSDLRVLLSRNAQEVLAP